MSDFPTYDDQFDSEVAELFQRSSITFPAPHAGLIDAAVNGGEARLRGRRRRHLTGLAASAALIGSLATVGVVAVTHRDAPAEVTRPVAVQFGLAQHEMPDALRRVLVDVGEVASPSGAASVAAVGALPGWVESVENNLEISVPDPGEAVRAAAATYRHRGSVVDLAVVIEHRQASLASMADLIPKAILGSSGGVVERTEAGVVVLQGRQSNGAVSRGGKGVGPAHATLMTDAGWVVRVLTPDLGEVSLQVLSDVAQDPLWLG